ncbi:MAG: single-stranded-DNA-specific exonuclease RecJ, partial [Ktedonobacteraceae bacterium]|nr:single-stranded-DNA-specific exonuclease RecJ [Ktedonobacteraceae bacterium]
MDTLSRTTRQWEIFPLLSKKQFTAAEQVGITNLQAQLLHNRGVTTSAEMLAFINADYQATHDPLTLIDMPRAVERIMKALNEREHITVYGDYDADGVTSSSLLFRVLRSLKHPDTTLDYHIPHRLRDGCGLNHSALDQLKARGTQLIITTDCASSDVEQVAYARSLGIDVVITDHHHPPPEIPRAYAMVNPWRPECSYGERYLCGVGIAFKLAQALYRASKRSIEDEMDLLDLVAIGTVADIAPLLGENHTLVRLGMQRLNQTNKPGLRALIRSAGLQPGRVRERDIAFGLAPRINAAGRMQDASIAFELLITDDEAEAAARVAELDLLNQSRQQETEELMKNVREQARLQPTRSVILVSGDNWHEGIIGLVAGKLAEEIDKPVLVLSNDRETLLSRGSARSRKGFNIIEALRGFAHQLERYGGHSQAAGFTIRSEHIQDLHDHLLYWKENGGPLSPAVI